MTLTAARLTIKQHRFEVIAAVLAALVVAVWGLAIELRLGALGIPFQCIDGWLDTGPAGRPQCGGPMSAYANLIGAEAESFFMAMAVVPFAVGLLGGVPIVARELEARTAQTAWSLYGSRTGWLVRQVAPMATLIGVAIATTAVIATGIAGHDTAWGRSAFLHVSEQGVAVAARAFGAFGLGLLLGALLGRALPAFAFGVVLSLALVLSVSSVRDSWLAGLDPAIVGAAASTDGEIVNLPGTVTTGWGWRAPDGQPISEADAMAVVPAGVVDAGDPLSWLIDRGYAPVILGVTDEMSLGWAPFDAAIFGFVGLFSLAGTVIVVDRRRPT